MQKILEAVEADVLVPPKLVAVTYAEDRLRYFEEQNATD